MYKTCLMDLVGSTYMCARVYKYIFVCTKKNLRRDHEFGGGKYVRHCTGSDRNDIDKMFMYDFLENST